MEHVIRVRDRRLTVCGATAVARGIGSDFVRLDLDAEWDGLTVVLTLGEGAAARPLM